MFILIQVQTRYLGCPRDLRPQPNNLKLSDPCLIRVPSVAESWFPSDCRALKMFVIGPENRIRVIRLIRGFFCLRLRAKHALGLSSFSWFPSVPLKKEEPRKTRKTRKTRKKETDER